MLYTNSNKTVELSSNEKKLNTKIAELEKELNNQKAFGEEKKTNIEEKKDNKKEKNNNIEEKEVEEKNEETEQDKQIIDYEMIKGAYEYVPNEEDFSAIYLLGDGSFYYNTELRADGGCVGYYTFDSDGKIILHCIIEHGSDIRAEISNKKMTVYLKNNEIVDNDLGRTYRKTDKVPEECVEFYPSIISNHLKSSLAEGALY